jgi:hypothetical protein
MIFRGVTVASLSGDRCELLCTPLESSLIILERIPYLSESLEVRRRRTVRGVLWRQEWSHDRFLLVCGRQLPIQFPRFRSVFLHAISLRKEPASERERERERESSPEGETNKL